MITQGEPKQVRVGQDEEDYWIEESLGMHADDIRKPSDVVRFLMHRFKYPYALEDIQEFNDFQNMSADKAKKFLKGLFDGAAHSNRNVGPWGAGAPLNK